VSAVRAFDFGERISSFDARALAWLRQRHAPRVTRAVRAITELGSLAGITSVASAAAFTLWRHRQRRSAVLVACAAAGAGVLSEGLKRLFGRQRPELALRLATTTGFAFPSGHSAASAATYGALALVIKSRGHPWLGLLVGTVVPASVGASRVYLNVHFPSDVVVGWVLGATWLGLVRRLIAAPRSR
jgi:membrane-associated phospholipid phosphatase